MRYVLLYFKQCQHLSKANSRKISQKKFGKSMILMISLMLKTIKVIGELVILLTKISTPNSLKSGLMDGHRNMMRSSSLPPTSLDNLGPL